MGVILGIDYGRVRVGLAISDELQFLAHPLETISAQRDLLQRITDIVRERNVEKAVVGMPRTMSGEMGPAALEVTAFVAKLRAMVSCEVLTWDERLTTAAAQRILHEAGRKTRESRRYIDQVAAQMMLQSYLDSARPNAGSGQAT